MTKKTNKKEKAPKNPEYYDPEKGPSEEDFYNNLEILNFLKMAYENIIKSEIDKNGKDFNLHKFIFEFARSIPTIIDAKWPEIKKFYLDPLNLNPNQSLMVSSFMTTITSLPLTMLLAEWHKTMHPEIYTDNLDVSKEFVSSKKYNSSKFIVN